MRNCCRKLTASIKASYERVSLEKVTVATERKISLILGSQTVKLKSQGQIAAIGEDLQYFWQIVISSLRKQPPHIRRV